MRIPYSSSIWALLTIFVFSSVNGAAGLAQGVDKGGKSPSYKSLDVGKANMRTGPSKDYPIAWVLVQRGLPVEELRRYQRWSQIKEPDGSIGWVRTSFLSGNRRAIVTERVRTLFSEPKSTATALYRVEAGVVADILQCENAWCEIDIMGKKGWLPRVHIWGTYPGERLGS